MTHDCPIPGCGISFITDQSLRTHITRKHPPLAEQLRVIKQEVEEANQVLLVYRKIPDGQFSEATQRLVNDMISKVNAAKERLQQLGYNGEWIPL